MVDRAHQDPTHSKARSHPAWRRKPTRARPCTHELTAHVTTRYGQHFAYERQKPLHVHARGDAHRLPDLTRRTHRFEVCLNEPALSSAFLALEFSEGIESIQPFSCFAFIHICNRRCRRQNRLRTLRQVAHQL